MYLATQTNTNTYKTKCTSYSVVLILESGVNLQALVFQRLPNYSIYINGTFTK